MSRIGRKKKNRISASAGRKRAASRSGHGIPPGEESLTESKGGAAGWSLSGRKEMLADSLKLPKDMLLGASILTMTGSRELWVENYKGIIEYTPQSIILQAKTGQISICGCGLVIDYYTSEDMKIIGDIRCVSYL